MLLKPNAEPQSRLAAPGWYPASDLSGRLMFWNGSEWLDPYERFEETAVDALTPHLQRMFEMGFEAGAAAAANVIAQTKSFA